MTAVRKSHPSQWRPDAGRLRARLELELKRREAKWPEVAAAALVARGMAGVGVEEWARTAGVAAEVVRRTEAGALAPSEVPVTLARRCHATAVPPERTDTKELP